MRERLAMTWDSAYPPSCRALHDGGWAKNPIVCSSLPTLCSRRLCLTAERFNTLLKFRRSPTCLLGIRLGLRELCIDQSPFGPAASLRVLFLMHGFLRTGELLSGGIEFYARIFWRFTLAGLLYCQLRL